MKQFDNLKFRIELSKLLITTIIIIFPLPIFIIILFTEPVIKVFFNSDFSSSPIFRNQVPGLITKINLYFSVWFPIIGISFALIILVVYITKFNINSNNNYFYNILIIFCILLIIIFSLLLLTLSEINYYYINAWCDNIKNNYTPDSTNPFNTELLIIKNQDNDSMHWLGYNNAFWINGIQISIICFVFMNFQLKTFTNPIDSSIIDQIEQTHTREFFGETKEKQFLSRILKPTPRNIAIFLIVFSFITLLPCVIYAVKISFFNNSFSKIVNLCYIIPTLSHINPEFIAGGDGNNYYGFYDAFSKTSKFSDYYYIIVALYLPQIFLILSSSFTMIFIYFVINKNNLSIKFLIVLIITLWLLVLITNICFFYSAYILDVISEKWDKQINSDPTTWNKFRKYLADSGVWSNASMIKTWLTQNESISLLILQASLFSSISIIGVSQMYKTKKQNNIIKTTTHI